MTGNRPQSYPQQAGAPANPVWKVAIPTPLYSLFDYLPASGRTDVPVGCRVSVPFGRGTKIGVVTGGASSSDLPRARLRAVAEVLDDEPVLPADLMELLTWSASYYHRPEGETICAALPAALRRARRRPRAAKSAGDSIEDLPTDADVRVHRGPELNPCQDAALAAVRSASGFQAFLLDGITGSGKTEVYFGIMESVLASGRQAMLLVPEIGLTPQLVARVRARFTCPLAVLHSGLSDTERLEAWRMAARAQAPIIIGTRSAVFAPAPALGVIIVDEEHDASYKQQDSLRYHARDVAVMRARRLGIPVVLGSATPALESLHNAAQGRYRRLVLASRAGAAARPTIRLVDLRADRPENGLSGTLAAAIGAHLARDSQVLLFLNRRGYAPTLLCDACSWVAKCRRCDAHMVLHRARRLLRCHHCDAQWPPPAACPDCGNTELRPLGLGTERMEETLAERFPDATVLRMDRDSTRRKGAMNALVEEMREGRRQILLGTQMLAKGHHLPNVTLAAVLDADHGLFGADYRAGERMGQLITQVAGRAGRADKPGEVLVQTRFPEHPLFAALIAGDYHAFAGTLLDERRETGMPPFRSMALLRAESVREGAPREFLSRVRELALELAGDGVELLGPAPAPMERRAGRWRAQLMLLADRRAQLHALLTALVPALDRLATEARARWSLDVDPIDEF